MNGNKNKVLIKITVMLPRSFCLKELCSSENTLKSWSFSNRTISDQNAINEEVVIDFIVMQNRYFAVRVYRLYHADFLNY